ncbi:N-acetylglucosamine-6-phosphate deacetylase [Egicoccus sp. AB-alg2]|uniref:N-acetylglucosamine-6-phosphate deacetylase n=1 Tax=Egicoccus sp. AB-alg2 TaxID=3242693 RepID=UPI00359D34C0
MLLRGAQVLSDGHRHGVADVVVAADGIVRVGQDLEDDGPVVDATGLLLAPGLVDIHIHGAEGYDTLDATHEALRTVARHLAARGVTSWAPTTASHHPEGLRAAIEAHRTYVPGDGEARSIGLHLEGPYLSPARCGAQDPAHLRDADPAEWRRWLDSGEVALLTVAPERDPDLALTRAASAAGVRIAIGHSDADVEHTQAAIDAGATQATHLFNGMPPLHHREPGVVGACLTDPRVFVQVIADLIHLHPTTLRLVAQAAGPARVVLVSDAMRATGLGDGEYLLADQRVVVRDGIARTQAGGLAGSTLDLLDGVARYQAASGQDLAAALHAASGVPAQAMGLHDRGTIAAGATADLVLLEPDGLHPLLTLISGVVAHDALPDERWIRR